MRLFVLLSVSVCALAQSTTTSYATDINGYRVAATTSASSDHTQTQLSQSVNGKQVPLEQREEKVLRKDATGTVTETIVRKYDPTGQLASTERVVTERQTTTGGGSSVHATTYRSDVNGREQEAERRTEETHVAGNSTSTDISIARPTLNGSFETVEKHNGSTNVTGDKKISMDTVYRSNGNGGMAEALRTVTQETKVNGQTTVNIANYEPGVTGQLELHSQSIATTVKHPDGSESTQVDLYAASAYGVVQEPGARQQIKEEQLITRKKGPNGTVIETTSIRRPSVSDPNRLGSPQQISETVCQGKCEPATEAQPAVPAQAAKNN